MTPADEPGPLTGFVAFPLVDGGGPRLALEAGVMLRTWGGAPAEFAGGTVFGCVDRPTLVTVGGDTFSLRAATFFVAPEGARVEGGRGLAIILPGYRGLFQLGGPLEARGRLQYIDGCTDTLLVSPPRKGEPCLNHLHVPAGTLQSAHTHPSLRAGLITRGRGLCLAGDQTHPLEPGLGWYIPAGLRHAFHTDGAALDVMAWHPDSDTGPTDEDHPMVNRTILQP